MQTRQRHKRYLLFGTVPLILLLTAIIFSLQPGTQTAGSALANVPQCKKSTGTVYSGKEKTIKNVRVTGYGYPDNDPPTLRKSLTQFVIIKGRLPALEPIVIPLPLQQQVLLGLMAQEFTCRI